MKVSFPNSALISAFLKSVADEELVTDSVVRRIQQFFGINRIESELVLIHLINTDHVEFDQDFNVIIQE